MSEPPAPPLQVLGSDANEAQDEEMEVLEAIYGEELTKEEHSKFTIRVFEHLILRVQYLPTYPAQTPPLFSLHCGSMESVMIDSISEALVRIFEDARAENPDTQGEAVVYNWVEWLRENVEEPNAEVQEEGSSADRLIRAVERQQQEKAAIKEQEQAEAAAAAADGEEGGGEAYNAAEWAEWEKQQGAQMDVLAVAAGTKLHHGETITDRKSVFQAHLAAVSCKSQVDAVWNALYTNKKIAHAAHNIMAYRLTECSGGGDGGSARSIQINECDDDGESAAGSRLLHLLELMGANNVLVVVTR
jgi:hypothetical protein